ncbi:MAG: GtrA family protein [Kofleriaceae bacterium]
MDTSRPLLARLRPLAGAAAGGLAGTVVDVGILATLCNRGVGVAYAAFIGAMAGAVLCFLANKYVAFRDRRRTSARQVVSFGGVALATALLMAAAMHLACDRAHLPYLTAKLVCAAVIFVCWSYPAQRRLVFASA